MSPDPAQHADTRGSPHWAPCSCLGLSRGSWMSCFQSWHPKCKADTSHKPNANPTACQLPPANQHYSQTALLLWDKQFMVFWLEKTCLICFLKPYSEASLLGSKIFLSGLNLLSNILYFLFNNLKFLKMA